MGSAKTAISRSAICIGIAAFALSLGAPGLEARPKQKSKQKPVPEAVVDTDKNEPLMLIVSVGQQKIDVYRGTKLLTSSAVSTGTASHPTMQGAFSILEKRRWHHSNLYSNAPMPWMNRLTWSGTALHAGVVPGYPASHGCIRLLYSFAPKLFQMTSIGDNVIISGARPKPTLIEHPNLFQPLPLSSIQASRSNGTGQAEGGLPSLAEGASPVVLAKTGAPARETSAAAEKSDGPGDKVAARASDKIEGGIGAAANIASDFENSGAALLQDIDAGIAAAAVEAAEPRSEAPLRMLLTRRTNRDRLIGVQRIFASMGYLPELNFDGTMGKVTIRAIKEFQKAQGMPETGTFDDELVKKVYEVAGKSEPPNGHLYVRQEFDRVFDLPVNFRNPDDPLGTHVYIALHFAPEDTKARWMAIDVQEEGGPNPLDRIEISDEVRRDISKRLTPGSTLMIADTSINSANLPKGGDFVVLAKTSGAKVSAAGDERPKARPRPRRQTVKQRRPQYGNYYGYRGQWRRPQQPFWFGGRPW